MAPLAQRLLPRNKLSWYHVIRGYGRVAARNRLHCGRHAAAPVRGGCIICARGICRLYAVRGMTVKTTSLVAAWKAASISPWPYGRCRAVPGPVKEGRIIMAGVPIGGTGQRTALIKAPPSHSDRAAGGVDVAHVVMAIPAEVGVVCGRAVFFHKEVSVRAAVAGGIRLWLALPEARVGLVLVRTFAGGVSALPVIIDRG